MNLTGLTIGNIYIVQRCIGDKEIGKLYRKNNPKKSYEPKYDCKCLLCGKLFTATGQSIKNRKNKNCGCSALQNHFNPKLSLDRINTNGNYEPSNCRFVTYQIQSNNRTNNRVIKLNNETDTLANWSRKLNIKYDFLQRKLAKGLTLKEILDGFQ